MSGSAGGSGSSSNPNLPAQGFRGAFVQFGLLQRAAKTFFRIQGRGTVRTGFQVPLKSSHARRVQFTIEVRMQMSFRLLTRHGQPPSARIWSAPFAVAGEREPAQTLLCQSGAR